MIGQLYLTLALCIYPVLFAFIAWYLLRKGKGKKETWFILGMLIMILAYMFLPNPSLELYMQGGNTETALAFGTIAGVLLFVAIYFFKRHMET